VLETDRDGLLARLAEFRRVIAAEAAAGSPDSDLALQARGMCVVLLWVLGEMESCWREYDLWAAAEVRREGRLAGEHDAPGPRRWHGERLGGRGLLVDLHQGGFGDLIQFARFAAALERLDGPVTVLTRPELLGLFSRSFAGRLSWIDSPSAAAPSELVTRCYGLPMQLRWRREEVAASVPYLHADPALRERWRGRLAGHCRPWIGLCWTREEPDGRCMPLAELGPLLRDRRATFVSLQQGGRREEILAAGCGGESLIELAGEIGTFDATAGLISNLDLVISIDTSIAHLAGALGRPTWLLLVHRASDMWNIGPTRESVDWYPTMRLFRQAREGSWDEALERLGASLSERLAGFRR
jgi:Glycosyltransferase family 9 (heptosyltransferase)